MFTLSSSILQLMIKRQVMSKALIIGHLAEALQHILHLLITPEEVRKRLFNRVEVSQGLVLLHDQLLDGVVRERLLFLVVL